MYFNHKIFLKEMIHVVETEAAIQEDISINLTLMFMSLTPRLPTLLPCVPLAWR